MTEGHPEKMSIDVPWGTDTIRVTNIPSRLPGDSTERQVSKVIEAGRANASASLSDASWRAVARATTGPDTLAALLRPTPEEPSGLLMVENVEGATLRSVITRVQLSELFPGPQPRTSMQVMEVPDPQVFGLAHEGQPRAVLQHRYESVTHLRNHVWQTLHATLSMNSYATSILTRSVTRNVITHPVEITFEDGTEPLHVLVVRDGITRLASAWSVLAGYGSDPGEVARLATDALLGTATAVGHDFGERLAASRAQYRHKLREEFERELKEQPPGPRAAQIAQSYVVPAQIAVGAEGHDGQMLSPEDIFDDAVRSVLASVHVEFKQWDPAAQNVEVITRALKRIIQQNDPRWDTADLQVVYGLAVGRIGVTEFPLILGGDPAPPGTALWRAVYLVSAITQPELLELLKDQAKAIKGDQRMSMKGFGELLGPIIDLPWRAKKQAVTKQARNAWTNGGVLSADVLQGWVPRPTDDFTKLVAPAMEGDDDARRTLAVAGGVALIADKLLTRNVGSSLGAKREKGGVPFRADVHQVIDGLARRGNELGLWTLALAANTFRSDALPQNAVTKRSLVGRPVPASAEPPYVYPRIDLNAPDRIARDPDGVPVPLYEWDVVAASNPERAANAAPPPTLFTAPMAPEAPSRDGEDAGLSPVEDAPSVTAIGETPPDQDPATTRSQNFVRDFAFPLQSASDEDTSVPPSQRAVAQRRSLRLGLERARDALDHLHALESEVGNHTPIVPADQLDELHKLLVGVMTDVENLRRRVTEEHAPENGEQEFEESPEA
jgi:hypothetical protein